jgi:hypothetical protein
MELEALQAKKILPQTYDEALIALVESRRLMREEAEKAEQAILEKAQVEEILEEREEFIDSHVHFPKYIRAEEYGDDFLSRKEIIEQYFSPEIRTIDRITLILSYYGCEKALYKNAKNMVLEVFRINEMDEIRKKFLKDLKLVRISHSGMNSICSHPALPNMELRVPNDCLESR